VTDSERSAEVRAFPWYASLAETVLSRVRVVGTLAGVGALSLLNFGAQFTLGLVGATAATLGALALARGVSAPAPTTLTASRAGVRWAGAFVPVTNLTSATLADSRGMFVLTLERGWQVPLRFILASRDEGRALIDALGLGLSDRTHASLTASSLTGRSALVGAAGLVALFPLAVAAGAATSGIAAGLWLALWPAFGLITFVPGKLVVGRDAITHRWLFFTRTLRIDEVVRAEGVPATMTEPHRVRLHLREGRPLEVPVSTADRHDRHAIEAVSRLVERIEHAMTQRVREAPEVRFAEWHRELAGASVKERLLALRPAAGAYRAGAFPFTQNEFFAVLEHPNAAIEQRMSAAIALAAQPGSQERLLSASRTTALPQLERAIRAALSGDDAALGAVLSPGPRVRVSVESIPVRRSEPESGNEEASATAAEEETEAEAADEADASDDRPSLRARG
jgi:hypothetical protein